MGISDKAFIFDGINDMIYWDKYDEINILYQDFSFSIWVKPSAL